MSPSHVLVLDPVATAHQTSLNIDPLSAIFGAEISGVDLVQPLAEQSIVDIKGRFVIINFYCSGTKKFHAPLKWVSPVISGNSKCPSTTTTGARISRNSIRFRVLMSMETPRRTKLSPIPKTFSGTRTGPTYKAPPACSLLYGIEIPSSGGNTSFVST